MPVLIRLSALARLGAGSLEHRRTSGLILYLAALAVMPALALVVGSASERPWVLGSASGWDSPTLLAIWRWGARDRLWYVVAVLAPVNVTLTAVSMPHDADVQLQFLMLAAVWCAIYLPRASSSWGCR